MKEGKFATFNLENRTFLVARVVKEYVDKLPFRITNQEIGRQLMRSAGSVGANYIEANEAFSKKDFQFRIKICRKEAKESCYWLELSSPNVGDEENKVYLVGESKELIKIFSTIINKFNYLNSPTK